MKTVRLVIEFSTEENAEAGDIADQLFSLLVTGDWDLDGVRSVDGVDVWSGP